MSVALEIAHLWSAAQLLSAGAGDPRVRTVWRLRDRHVKDAGRCIQHMQKALNEMNVQLHTAISDLSGLTGQAIIRAILSGQRDPRKLAALRHCRIQPPNDADPDIPIYQQAKTEYAKLR